jgi:ABC-type glutathione transport system ATPase component
VRLKAELGLTLIIIEHDIPMIMALADRIICMADGEVISAGTPEDVRNDPGVVEAYLGGSLEAIERSSTKTAQPAELRVPEQAAARDESLAQVVPGLGKAKEGALLEAFGSVQNIRDARVEDLVAVRGIGPGLAARIQTSLADRLSERSNP